MKKIPVICILVAILVVALVPAVAFADTAHTTGGNMCLINPVSIVAIGDYIFVADDVDTDHSVILCFDISSETPVYRYTYTCDKQIQNMSEIDGKLCVIYQDGVELFAVGSKVFTTPEATYALENVSDVTYGVYTSDSVHNSIYALDNNDLSYLYLDNVAQGFRPTDYALDIVDSMACLYVDNSADANLNGYVYCVWNSDIKRFNTKTGNWGLKSDDFNKLGVYAPTLMIKGIFTYQMNDTWQIGLYSDTLINRLEKRHYGPLYDGSEFEYSADSIVPLERDALDNNIILDVCYANGKIFILNSNKQVEIYKYNNELSTFVRCEDSIGTDVVSITGNLPTDFEGFILARSLGYPTNIVYKTTNDSTSIENIIPDITENFVILQFDGADELPFYYVLVGEKYGWIKKSDGATTPESDPKIEIIRTEVSPDSNITYKAKFISANTVYIYELPLSNSKNTQFNQSVDNPKDVTVLQKFTEKTENGDVEWYYVSYEVNGEEHKGFIQSGLIGHFYTVSSAPSSGTGYLEDMKVNTSLFEAVKIYFTSAMVEGEEMYDENGHVIKIYSGTLVKAIRTEGDATYVEVRRNGVSSCGWMPTKNLIHRIRMTTNAIVGLSILAAAIVLGTVFTLAIVQRKKQKAKSPTQNDDIYNIDDVD